MSQKNRFFLEYIPQLFSKKYKKTVSQVKYHQIFFKKNGFSANLYLTGFENLSGTIYKILFKAYYETTSLKPSDYQVLFFEVLFFEALFFLTIILFLKPFVQLLLFVV